MPRNPDKTPCSVDGCRAWAIHGSDPPLCSPHRTRAARIEESVAACTEESAPGCTEESAPGCTEESAPGCTEESAPGCTEESAPGCTEESAPGCTEESAPGCPWWDSPLDPEERPLSPCINCESRWDPPQGTPRRILLEHAEMQVRGVGAPLGNQNRRTHGFYARALAPQEQADLDSLAADTTLDAEIAVARVALCRVLDLLSSGNMPGPDPRPLSADEIVRLTGLAIRGAGAVSRLLRARQALADHESEKDQPTCAIPLLLMLGARPEPEP